MANEEHLKIFKQGIEVWNEWRKVNEDINTVFRPDLSWAELSGLKLRGVNLRNVNLEHADLSRAELNGAKLINALCDSADFTNANLYRADLRLTSLKSAYLNDADLCGADLSEANLQAAFIFDANLTNAKLWNTVISGANLTRANLHSADLRYSDLRETILKDATLTGVRLYHNALIGWIIEDVNCDYIYFDENGKERQPQNRDFERGEFEQLYRSVPTYEYAFEHGMRWIDAAMMNEITKEIQKEKPELGVRLISFDIKGFYPRASFEISSQGFKEEAEKAIATRYESRIHKLEVAAKKYFLESHMLEAKNKTLQEVLDMLLKDLATPRETYIDININFLENEGITRQQVEELVQQIKHNHELIKSVQQLQSEDIDILKFAIERLNPYLREAFNKEFDPASTKVLKTLSKAVLKFFPGDIVGDQIDW